jgi:hypothetical protein
VALPILLFINPADRPLNTILTGEGFRQEIVRTLVGSIGLVLSVPLTTAVGVALSGSPAPRHPRSCATGHGGRATQPADIGALYRPRAALGWRRAAW